MARFQDPYDFSGLTDEELLAMDQEANTPSLPGQRPGFDGTLQGQGQPASVAPSAFDPTTLTDSEILELDNANRATVMGDGEVILQGGEGNVSAAQEDWYLARQADGQDFRSPDVEWGSAQSPYPQVGDRLPRSGEYYLSLDGELKQVPGEVRSSEALGFMKGLLQPINNAAGLLEDGVGMVVGRDNLDRFNDWTQNFGMVGSVDEAEVAQNAFYERELQRGRRPGAIGEFAGNIVGTLPIAASMPATLGGSVVGGALGGAALTRDEGMGVVDDILLGGAFGGVGDRVGRFVTSTPIVDQGLRTLREAGVRLTPGQMLGVPNLEVAIGKVIPGIDGAVRNSADDFGRVAVDQAMRPFDENFRVARTSTASQGIEEAADLLRRQAVESARWAREVGEPVENFTSHIEEALDGLDAVRRSIGRDGRVTPSALLTQLNNSGADLSDSMLREMSSPATRFLSSNVPASRSNVFDKLVGDNMGSVAAPIAAHLGFGGAASAPLAASSLIYSGPGQSVVRAALMGDRPTALQAVGRGIDRVGGYGLFGGATFPAATANRDPARVTYRNPNDPNDLYGLY